jgi:molybdopterin-guanine dinucleotide biosynthesis protein A
VVLLACDAPLLIKVDRGPAALAVAHDSAAMVRQGVLAADVQRAAARVLPVLEQAWAAGERSLQKALLVEAVQGLACRR